MDDGGPSVTARRVAAHRLGFTRIPARYGDPAADDALARDVADGQEVPAGRMHDYLAARTAFFDRVVTDAIGAGTTQIVVGAAGYDGRAFRYARRGVRWFELDHPSTQRDKLTRLDRLGIGRGHVTYVAADFTRDPVTGRLRDAGLDPAVPALFLLEGVAVYLDVAVVESVLAQLREVAADGSRLAISVSVSGRESEVRSRFQAAVAALGEPARSAFGADEAEALLARAGWQVLADQGDPGDEDEAARRKRRRTAGLLLAAAVEPVPKKASTTKGAKVSVLPHPPGTLPLSALLSQTLVAFTIEFDNEAEHRIPHHTTDFGAPDHGGGVWLTSMAMWENCMRFVTDEPITVGELRTLARTGTNLDGMRRWGYLTIDGSAKKIPHGRLGPDSVLRATARGLQAREIWAPLGGDIEQRWRERYGAASIGRLRDALAGLVGQLDPGLPDCLPILGPELISRGPDPDLPPRPHPAGPAALPLSALLARTLLTFALEYERESVPSLAVAANLLRVLDDGGTRPRDLPAVSGLSKAAVSWALGVLTRSGRAAEEPDPAASRGKVAKLTEAGLGARQHYQRHLAALEERWRDRFGAGAIDELRQALETLAASDGSEPPPLWRALEPYPDNWRAQVHPAATLPYYPMVLHRGGYPDGS